MLTLAAILAMAARLECGAKFGVEPDRIAAVAEVESGYDPMAIHVNGSREILHPATVAEAVQVASSLIARRRSIDLGLMQINNAQLHGMSLEDAFNPCTNMAAGAAHMRDDYDAVWRLAVRRYNCGRIDCSASYASAVTAAHDRILNKHTVLDTATAPQVSQAAPDPNAPPSWDVWAEQDYQEQRHAMPASAPPAPASLAVEPLTPPLLRASGSDPTERGNSTVVLHSPVFSFKQDQ